MKTKTKNKSFSLTVKTIALGVFLTAAFFSAAAPDAPAATAYYVGANDVYVRAKPQSYAMGRLYNHNNTSQGRMDIQYVDSNGWAYGYAYGYVNRCVWAQYSFRRADGTYDTNFWTHGTGVANRCRTTNMYLENYEFTTGEIWMNGDNSDGVVHRIANATHMWDNWVWGGGWGNHNYRGVAPAGSHWKIRYTTNDGAGVMARPCATDANGNVVPNSCTSDWFFIQRSAL